MRENGIQGRSKRRFKRTTDSRHDNPIAPNLLARRFDVGELNRAWVTDVTAIATDEGWLYLAPMLDLCSRRVLAWAASEHNDTALALEVLREAILAAPPASRVPSPLRPRQPLRERRLPRGAACLRGVPEHEPQGRLLGQRGRRELLRHAASRARRPRAVRHPRGSDARHRRLHRQLLQRRATPLAPRLPQSPRVRIAITSSATCGIVMLSTEAGSFSSPDPPSHSSLRSDRALSIANKPRSAHCRTAPALSKLRPHLAALAARPPLLVGAQVLPQWHGRSLLPTLHSLRLMIHL